MPNIFITGLSEENFISEEQAIKNIFEKVCEFKPNSLRFFINPLIEIRDGKVISSPPYMEVHDGGAKPQENYDNTAKQLTDLFNEKNFGALTVNFTTINPYRYYTKGQPLRK